MPRNVRTVQHEQTLKDWLEEQQRIPVVNKIYIPCTFFLRANIYFITTFMKLITSGSQKSYKSVDTKMFSVASV